MGTLPFPRKRVILPPTQPSLVNQGNLPWLVAAPTLPMFEEQQFLIA